MTKPEPNAEPRRDADTVPVVPGRDVLDTQELLVRIKGLESRDLEGWTIAALGVLALAVTLLAVFVPDSQLILGNARFNGRFILLLILILAVVVLLVNLQALRRRQTLRNSRAEYVRQLLRADAAEKLALTDPLTGLSNRRHLEQFLTREAKRSSRTGIAYSLLMLDLVGFGELNRRLGHLEGDRLLRELAVLLREVYRQTDGVFRYGGDEFVIVLVDTDAGGSQRALERLLERVEEWNEGQPEDGARLRLAHGRATSGAGLRPLDVLRSADAQLIAMKRSGLRAAGASSSNAG